MAKNTVKKKSKDEIRKMLMSKLSRYYGITYEEATYDQIYRATILSVKDILAAKRQVYREKIKKQQAKKVYYLCMEFLIGPSLRNNLMNIGVMEEYRQILADWGFDIEKLCDMEPNPGLGNGGLGRLAACFMDSLTSQDYPAYGFSICYEYGLFKQKIIDGNQVELPDNWMSGGEGWLVLRPDKAFDIQLGGDLNETWENGKCNITCENYRTVRAVPYDMMISGADSEAVNVLRLWKAVDTTNFNMSLFSQGEYIKAIEETSNAEIISKVLYPSDDHDEGKLLRLTQQYFLVSASLQSIIRDHLAGYGTLSNFADKVAIHINDTHPALVIPELMRILLDVYSYSWDDAWDIVTKVVSYTNHTVLPEALEKWNENLFKLQLPRIYMIVCEINRRLCADLWNLYPGDWDRISNMAIIGYNQVRMANLSVAASHTVNGVSALHSEILKQTVFHDYYKAMPNKFTNVTNGIAHRRWLCYSNPQLAKLLDDSIGTGYRKDSLQLSEFLKFKDDPAVIDELRRIKHENKQRFAEKYFEQTGIALDTHSVFDVQVKRIHEYKRQLLNVLKIITLYNILRENPNAPVTPVTFIFGGKAAPGYYLAKDIIKLIWSVGKEIEEDPVISKILKVVYVEDYNVSTAEILMPASDISEQISLAGKEASGTGCMKFMINGALTLGTLDGANVEMKQAVGDDNIFIFGLTASEVDEIWKQGYNSLSYYIANPELRATVDSLNGCWAGNDFSTIFNYLTNAHGVADPYMCLADFESYFITYKAIMAEYKNRDEWTKKSLANIAGAGFFSSDRSIHEYARNIWHISEIR
ncbi:MAG: glycogen/starch/alpha-glucan phosphorylase [Clostridia bacterium]|nr:glycogen/starch/alpha-glucan phosphorylase [Clostridia bacterium]